MIADRACRAVAFLAALGVPAAGQANIAVTLGREFSMFEKGKIYPPWGLLEVHSSHIFRIEISSTEQMLCLP